jgi:hypothetical protein
MLSKIQMIKNKRRAEKLRDKLLKYDGDGYHRELLDNSKLIWSIFSKDFVVGDKISWLGHDGVYGLLHGQEIVANEEDVKRKNQSSFWKKIDELNFEPYKNL